MKKFAWILIAAALLAVIVVPTAAFANNGPHGGYVADTDMCAACHRAHTAPSSLTWTDNQGGQKNALLITDSAQTYLFCLACHDAGAQGADTNVVDGVYEGTAFGTNNTDMISGAFGREDADNPGALYDPHGKAVTSTHLMNGQSWGAYGGGLYGSKASADATGNDPALYGTGAKIVMDCTTCHDPHGSSNYRLLKDSVYGVAVGGYDGTAVGTDPFGHAYSATNPKPTPYVVSNETGFPQGGFQLHVSYAGTYDPDYTVAQYAKAPADDVSKGMTNWCAGCHTAYMVGSETSTYNAADGAGFVTRHRHPMNVRMDQYTGYTPLVLDSGLPLAHDASETANDSNDWIDCMTCHNAHGSTAVMTGFAVNSQQVGENVIGFAAPDSALLKMDNRGVCEACHNK